MSVSSEQTLAVRQPAQDRTRSLSRMAAVQGHAVVLGWMMLAPLVRLVMLRDVRRVDQDGLRYLIYAQYIARGAWFHPALHGAPYSPFYPLLTVLVGRSGLPLQAAGFAVSIACGAALVGVLFLLAEHLFGRLTGHMTALLAALNGHLITYSSVIVPTYSSVIVPHISYAPELLGSQRSSTCPTYTISTPTSRITDSAHGT